MYKIKSNDRLFNEWMRVSASPHTKLGLHVASIVQNNMELTAEQLNEWYKETGKLINKTEEHFVEVIEELEELRQQTVKYIKKINS